MSALPSIPEPVPTRQEADHAGALYQEYSGRILGYCLRRLPSREEAEDAVQHTFMNAFRGLRQGVVPRSEAAWLFKIAENVCSERRRSAWRRSRLEVVQDPDGMAGLAVAPQRSHDELAGLADALAELPPNQQRAILLREWQGLSYREIAAQLDLTEGAVETLLFRARRSLARKLDRSRGRAWGNVGALGAWGKSIFGGAAAKVAATAVLVAGIAAATPAIRHELIPGSPAVHPTQPAGAQHAVKRRAPASAPAVRARSHAPAQAASRRSRPGNRTVVGATQHGAPANGPPPGAVAPPAPAPPGLHLPPVRVPNPPPLPVQLPPPPPLPINVPDLPPVPPVPAVLP